MNCTVGQRFPPGSQTDSVPVGLIGVSAVSTVRLERLEEDIISTGAGLIILDSVASVVRKEFDTTLPGNLMHRSNLLCHEATTLKYLAHQFNIPVSTPTTIGWFHGGVVTLFARVKQA